MKHLILIVLLHILPAGLFAQKVIEHPRTGTTTAHYVQITRIELSDTATVIDFMVRFTPGMWIRVPRETWIQDSRGGEKLFIRSARGIRIQEEHYTPEDGINRYTLYFPPLDPSAETFHYLESHWKIFDIEIVPQERFSVVPDELLGNWLRTDGSNEWVFGFHENMVVYDQEIWHQVMISQKEDSYQMMLQKEGRKRNLVLRPEQENLLIGTPGGKMEQFSRKPVSVPGYLIPDDTEFSGEIFKKGNAVFRGLLKGYHPLMGETGMVYVNNILTQEQESFLINIQPDGSFSVEFPMDHPQPVLVSIINRYEAIFCEPGKTTFYYVNLHVKPEQEGEPQNLFMGETARINSDLLALNLQIRGFNIQNLLDRILDFSPGEFKSYFLDVKKKEMEALDQYCSTHLVSKKAQQIKRMKIGFGASQHIFSYNMYRDHAYRTKHQVPRDQREIPLEKVVLPPDYHRFLNPDELNDPVSLVAGQEYNTLINRIAYADGVFPTSVHVKLTVDQLLNGFASKNIVLSDKEKALILKIADVEAPEKFRELIKQDSLFVSEFMTGYSDIFSEVSQEASAQNFNDLLDKAHREHYGLESGLVKDIMEAQMTIGRMKAAMRPLSEAARKRVLTRIGSDYIASYVLNMSNELSEEIRRRTEMASTRSGFVINETPIVTEGDLFDTIMKKYKGNVVFVDFWATWCGPCRAGMTQIKPLKEELKGKNIRFVYITNPSSPKDTWNLLIPDIEGEHYYLTNDEYNRMAARFKVSGIPHYVLVDKTGKVVQEKIWFASSNDELKRMFNQYLE